MNDNDFKSAIEIVKAGYKHNDISLHKAITILLKTKSKEKLQLLRNTAIKIRNTCLGNRLAIRALIEFSSFCSNSCLYCGLNRTNQTLERYRLSKSEIELCTHYAYQTGIRTVVLQSGEDGSKPEYIAQLISAIKKRGDIAVTLSIGEYPKQAYALWKDSGADRYLLRIETTDKKLFKDLHPGRTVQSRLQALADLQNLGYQTGSGLMVGVPGQTIDHIAKDLVFFAKQEFEMIGIGPYIPHPDTVFAHAFAGSAELTLQVIAVTRILLPFAWMPATTALGSLERDWRIDALVWGANVIMPNFSPQSIRTLYSIYPEKCCTNEQPNKVKQDCVQFAQLADMIVDWSRADAPGF